MAKKPRRSGEPAVDVHLDPETCQRVLEAKARVEGDTAFLEEMSRLNNATECISVRPDWAKTEAARVLSDVAASKPAQSPKSRGGRPKEPHVKQVEDLLREGLSVDAITARTGESAANVRQIKRRMNAKT